MAAQGIYMAAQGIYMTVQGIYMALQGIYMAAQGIYMVAQGIKISNSLKIFNFLKNCYYPDSNLRAALEIHRH